MKIKIIPLTNTNILIKILEKNPYILKKFLISILHLNIKPKKCTIYYVNKHHPIENKNNINININNYIFINIKLHKKETFKYKNIQLILNTEDKNKHIGEDIIVPYSLKTNSIYNKTDIIYIRYLDYYNKLYHHNTIKKAEDYWLAMLTSKNTIELNNILKKLLSNKLRKIIIRQFKQSIS